MGALGRHRPRLHLRGAPRPSLRHLAEVQPGAHGREAQDGDEAASGASRGNQEDCLVNFMELCKAMHRQPEHVLNFMMGELGTSGSLDGTQRLIVKGRFLPKAFEGVLRRYVNEYVLCHACKPPDTLLDKDQSTRLYVLRCQQCGAGRSVTAMKQGFVAQIGRRKKV